MARTGRGGRGGYQRPARPAAVSGPGAMARRTDGGPADRQPIRPVPGSSHGDRQASVEQQQAAPLRDGGAAGPAPTAAPAPAQQAPDPFGPSRRPYEPVTAGAALGPGPGPEPKAEARETLVALYEATGLDELLEMVEELDDELG